MNILRSEWSSVAQCITDSSCGMACITLNWINNDKRETMRTKGIVYLYTGINSRITRVCVKFLCAYSLNDPERVSSTLQFLHGWFPWWIACKEALAGEGRELARRVLHWCQIEQQSLPFKPRSEPKRQLQLVPDQVEWNNSSRPNTGLIWTSTKIFAGNYTVGISPDT